MYYEEKMIDGVLHCRTTPDGEWRPANQPVAWCRSSEFNDPHPHRQSFFSYRKHHDDFDMALYAAPVALPATRPATMTDQPQHRATPEQWALVASEAADGCATHSCILELRDRIAALEAAQANQFRGVTEKVSTIGQAHTPPDWAALPGIAKGLPNLDLASWATATSDHERAATNMSSCPSVDRIPDFTGAVPTTPEPHPASAEAQPAGSHPPRRLWEAMEAEFYQAMIRAVAQAASLMHPDKNLTWERVAQWLEQEANQ